MLDPLLMGVTALAFSADGTTLLAALSSGDVAHVEFGPTGARVAALLHGHQGAVTDVAFLPGDERRRAVSAGADGSLHVWDLESSRSVQTLKGHRDQIVSIDVASDGTLFTGSRDRTVRAWSLDGGTSVTTSIGQSVMSFDAFPMAFSRDGRLFAWHKSMREVTVSDAATGAELFTTPAAGGLIAGVALDATGTRLVTFAANDRLAVWDVPTGTLLEEHVEPELSDRNLTTMALSADGALAAWSILDDREQGGPIVGVTGRIEVRRTASWVTVASLPIDAAVSSFGFTADGERLVTGHHDGSLHAWDLGTGRAESSLRLSGADTAVFLALDVTGDVVAASRLDTTDHRIFLWRPGSAAPPRVLEASTSPIQLAFHPGGRRLMAGSWEGRVSVWDLDRLTEITTLGGHRATVAALVFSADGKRLGSADASGLHRVWHTAEYGVSHFPPASSDNR